MFFNKKKYLMIPLSKMEIFEGEDRHNVVEHADSNDTMLANGVETMLLFECSPKDTVEYGPIKEMFTGVVYEKTHMFLRGGDVSIYSKDAGVVCFDEHQFDHRTNTEVKNYLKQLKKDKVYNEYLEKISNFYNTANRVRTEEVGRSK